MEDCPKVIALSLKRLSQVKEIALAILILFTVASATMNILLILSFIGTKQINKNATNFLIFIMSINDALLSCVVLPLMVVVLYYFENGTKCNALPQDIMFVISLLVTQSAVLTDEIALDRYLHMDPNALTTSKWKNRFRKSFKRPQIYFMLLFNFLIAVLSAWYTYEKRKLNESLIGVLQVIELIIGLVGLSFICGLYLKGYFGIYQHVAQNHVHAVSNGIDHRHRSRYLRNLSKTVLLLIVAMILTYVPILIATGILSLTRLIDGYAMSKELVLLYTISYLLACLNGLFNSMIIFYRNKEAKQWVLQKLMRYSCRERGDEVHGQKRSHDQST